MADILDEIIANKRVEVAEAKAKRRSMKAALAASESGIIAEFKRKSPSKGWIHADAEPQDVVPEYAKAGASAISILTDEKYFGGSLDFIRAVRPMIDTPILRKDFVIDEFQLYEAKSAGADAVLLIAADLTIAETYQLTKKAHSIGLEVLLEIHDVAELEYVKAVPEVDMLGVNNRALGTFHTDVRHSFDIAEAMREAVKDFPNPPLLVSESGISSPETVKELRKAGFRGFLIGETFMKSSEPGAALRSFIDEIDNVN